MLPSHLQQSSSSAADGRGKTTGPAGGPQQPPRLGGQQLGYTRQQQPPLGLTGVLCDSHTVSVPNGRGKLHYTVFRPRHVQFKPPLICVAGGPFLPSTYLSPLVHLVTDRSVVLFDAIGCGQSSATTSAPAVSKSSTAGSSSSSGTDENCAAAAVDAMVDDLEFLIGRLPCEEFHMFGHSFGGILVYEYLKRKRRRRHKGEGQKDDDNNKPNSNKTCRTAILAGTPVSIEDCESHCQDLLRSIRDEFGGGGGQQSDEEEFLGVDVQQVFRERHECRVDPLPLPLQQAFEMAGFTSSRSSAGLRAVRGYKATSAQQDHESGDSAANGGDDQEENSLHVPPPVLILRGQYDFVTEDSCESWRNIFGRKHSTTMTLAGCSHYGMVEMESLYGSVLTAFLQDHDPAGKPFIPPVLRSPAANSKKSPRGIL